jgi:hypothetical protein
MTVEFALVLTIFLAMMFATMEYARLMYLWNSQQEATRRTARAAAVTDFSDATAMLAIRRSALFRSDDGPLPLSDDLTPERLRIEYLSLSAAGALTVLPVLPGCPARNVVNCMADPHADNCIRMVRVRVCGAGPGVCPPLPYVALLPLAPVPATLPPSTTIVHAESLGYRPGQALCP